MIRGDALQKVERNREGRGALPVKQHLLIIADTPQQALALWRHWDEPTILWLQGGHILNNMSASRRFVVEAMATSGVTGR